MLLKAYLYGDFFEFFDDDAKAVAAALGLVVTTTRDGNHSMCGIPKHRWEGDRAALAAAGHSVRLQSGKFKGM